MTGVCVSHLEVSGQGAADSCWLRNKLTTTAWIWRHGKGGVGNKHSSIQPGPTLFRGALRFPCTPRVANSMGVFACVCVVV